MLKVQGIAEIIDKCLYAVHWEGRGEDSFEEMDSLFGDAERLKTYLDKNIEYYRKGYYHYSEDEAVYIIMNEYEELVDEILFRAEQGPYEEQNILERLFSPLDNRKGLLDYKKGKAKSRSRKPMIRVYGYKLDTNCIVISGYGIKLTATMYGHPDLKEEYKKLDYLEKYFGKSDFSFCI